MSHFRWEGNVVFFGNTYYSTQMPWFYIPGWFLISIPELWLLLGLLGIVFLFREIIQAPFRFLLNTKERNYVLYLLCFFTPPLMVIFLKSVVLDDWRHLYFIYAGFVFILLHFLQKILKTILKLVVIVLCIVQLADIAFFFVKYHPFEQVYFNHLVSHKKEYLRKNFDFEYWGCSFMNGYHWLLTKYPNGPIKVCNNTTPLIQNTFILNANDRARIILLENEKDADYYLTDFRYHPEDFTDKGAVLYEINVLNSTIMRIQKLPK
jgi:hypothetical protein